jgi:hypothetical protein
VHGMAGKGQLSMLTTAGALLSPDFYLYFSWSPVGPSRPLKLGK